MKAAQIQKYGGPEVIEIREIPQPVAGKGQVLIEVNAASINPIDWKVREGYLKDFVPLTFPVTVALDLSGTVKELGEGVTQYKVGDEVYGQGGVLTAGSGAIAQYAAASIERISSKPTSVDHIHAAALPLAGNSALQALYDHIKLAKGQKILIHGGAGGIGSFAIQMAKSIGAYVATTVNEKDTQYVKDLGADEIIDYKKQNFETILHDYDAVLDTVGGDTTTKSFNVLKKGGILVSMVGQPDADLAKQHEVTAIMQQTDGNIDRYARLTKLVDSGKIKINVDKVFPLEQTKEAFIHQETAHPRGKVVISL